MKIVKMKRDILLQVPSTPFRLRGAGKAEAAHGLFSFQKWNDLFFTRSRRTLRTDRNWLMSNEDRPEMSNAEMLKKKHSLRSKLNSEARSSVEERYIDIVEVVSSILSAPIALLGGVSKILNVITSLIDVASCSYWGNRLEAFCCFAAPSGRILLKNLPCKATALPTQ